MAIERSGSRGRELLAFPEGGSGQRVSVGLQISLSIWTCMIYKSLGNLWTVNNSLTLPLKGKVFGMCD